MLPTCRREMAARGFTDLDVVLVTGDAYVDHPAFGAALVGRWLEHHGYRVGVVAQPRWDRVDDLVRMGRPRLFVGVTAGNLDSMLCHLTAEKKPRSEDPYSPGGQPGRRPNRASIVYANLCRQAFPGLPVVLGGIEASLRRVAHYDYWSDRMRRSVALDAKADLLVYGMAERGILEVARRLAAGQGLEGIPGTVRVQSGRAPSDGVRVPSYEDVVGSPMAFVGLTRMLMDHRFDRIVQPHGDQAVLVEPPADPLCSEELDALYDLPFTREAHPSYSPAKIPALETVRDSVVIVRGCCGGCSFCSLSQHQGRTVQSRSRPGVIREIERLCAAPGFSGTISDLGGPSANLYGMACSDPAAARRCRRASCLFPDRCARFVGDARPIVDLLGAVRRVRGVRRAFVASGVRPDLANSSPDLIEVLARHHVGGQLSVTPEHCAPAVLRSMGKPPIQATERFVESFALASRRAGKQQAVAPYLMVGHPGDSLEHAIELGLYLKRKGIRPRQVQQFIPTPMTVSTCMYVTGIDPMTGEPVAVTRDLREKRALKALLFWHDARHFPLAREALRRAGRMDLVGRGHGCLVPPAER